MNDGDALLRAILDHPREDTPRLAFADYLEEHGHHARAAMIRDHIAAYQALFDESTIVGLDDFLLQTQDRFGPLLLLMRRVTAFTADPLSNGLNPFLQLLAADGRLAWCRGFVDYVRVTFDGLMDHASEIFLEHPVTRVDIVNREPFEDDGTYYWRRANDFEELHDSACMLPGELFDTLVGEDTPTDDPNLKRYSARLSAFDALSAVCVEVGNAEAHRGT